MLWLAIDGQHKVGRHFLKHRKLAFPSAAHDGQSLLFQLFGPLDGVSRFVWIPVAIGFLLKIEEFEGLDVFGLAQRIEAIIIGPTTRAQRKPT